MNGAKVLIVYDSKTGNTEGMAEAVVEGKVSQRRRCDD